MASIAPAKSFLLVLALLAVVLVGWLDASSATEVTALILSAKVTPTGGWSVYACRWNPANECRRVWIPNPLVGKLEAQGVRFEQLAAGRSFRARVHDVNDTTPYWQLATPDGFALYARRAR